MNTVDPVTAARSYSTSYYLAHQPDNLHILTGATVHEIVLCKDGSGDEDDYVATGVRFSHGGKQHVVNVTREVVLSAGTVQSPQILEMSGIGSTEVLKKAGVQVKVDSPMVGENLQDHMSEFPVSRMPVRKILT